MAEKDRLYIDTTKSEFVRGINKNNQYLKFDNQKDLFMYAMTLGANIPSSFEGKKDALFLEKDMNYEDVALIYSMVYPELEKLEQITDKEKVYTIAQNMANTGFVIMERKIEENSFDNLTMKLLIELDEKFKELQENGMFNEL